MACVYAKSKDRPAMSVPLHRDPREHSLFFVDFCKILRMTAKKVERKVQKEEKIFQKGLDKGERVCYNKQCEPKGRKSLGVTCRCGGTGRRPGLKIP